MTAWTKAVEAAAVAHYASDDDCTDESARLIILGGKDEEHSGDCNNRPWTCCRCVYEVSVRSADAALRAALASLEAEGWVLVPAKSTPDMNITGGIAISEETPLAETYVDEAAACYRAMLAAAPRLSGTEETRAAALGRLAEMDGEGWAL